MSKSSIPLKLTNSGVDLHEFAPAEENYLAYLVGQQIVSSAADTIGNLSLSSTNATAIGSFVDTFFNEPTGTHPASQITSSETTTTIHQKSGTADESGANFKRPVGYYSHVDAPGLYEMADVDLNTLANRVIGKLVELDYPGSFKLATGSPGVDYSVFIDSIFSDTQADGTTVPYHVYIKNTGTSPSAVRPMRTKISGGEQSLVPGSLLSEQTLGFEGWALSSAIDPVNKRVVYVYNNNDDKIKAVIGTIGSDNVITWGSETVIYNGSAGADGGGSNIIFDSNSGSFILVLSTGNIL